MHRNKSVRVQCNNYVRLQLRHELVMRATTAFIYQGHAENPKHASTFSNSIFPLTNRTHSAPKHTKSHAIDRAPTAARIFLVNVDRCVRPTERVHPSTVCGGTSQKISKLFSLPPNGLSPNGFVSNSILRVNIPTSHTFLYEFCVSRFSFGDTEKKAKFEYFINHTRSARQTSA